LPAPVRAYSAPRLSPDSSRLAVWTPGLDRNVWTYDLARGTLTRLTTEGRNSRAIWTPDGKRITYSGSTSAGVDNIFWVAADGSGSPERLTTSANVQYPSAWSSDGRTLAFVEAVAPGNTDVLTISLDGDRQPKPLLHTRFVETYPEFSPDGRWLAYVSNESGRDEVYVQPYPALGPRKQISPDGGVQPAWSHSGRVLFYTSLLGAGPLRMMAVSITTARSFEASAPQTLFEGNYQGQTLTRGYDVSFDDQRFFLPQMKPQPPIQPAQMILVQNWIEELKRRVPTR
jgi:Tol biopolymer transport system component